MTIELAREISLLADVGLLLPLAIWLAAWLASADFRLSIRWTAAITGVFVVIGLSKLLWALWHFEIPVLRFRMFSGHMALACAVWPTAGTALAGGLRPRHARAIRFLTYALCTGIAVSRLFGAHTPSEIVGGALVGLAAERHVAARLSAVSSALRFPGLFVAGFCAIVIWRYGSPIYSVDWFNQAAVWLGHR